MELSSIIGWCLFSVVIILESFVLSFYLLEKIKHEDIVWPTWVVVTLAECYLILLMMGL